MKKKPSVTVNKRNPVARHDFNRAAVHEKPNKSKRRKEKQEVCKNAKECE